MEAGAGNTYPVGVIAKLLLLTERRIQQLVKEQIIPKPNSRGEYDLVGCVQGYVGNLQERAERSEEPQRVRLDRLRGDQAELELKKMARDLVPVAEIMPALDQWVSDVSAFINGLPERHAESLQAMPDIEGVHQILNDMMRSILQVLGEYTFAVKRIHSVDAAEDDQEISAAA